MKTVYLIYCMMDDFTLALSNRYGQYDLLKYEKVFNSINYTLWGFTTKKSILDRFLMERPVKDRYLIRKVEKDPELMEYLRTKNRYRLKLMPFDLRENIFNKPTPLPNPEPEEDEVTYRVSNDAEYDYVSLNCFEIFNAIFDEIFQGKESSFPNTIEIFQDKVQHWMRQIHLPEFAEVYGIDLKDSHGTTEGSYLPIRQGKGLSFLVLYYLVYKDIIF